MSNYSISNIPDRDNERSGKIELTGELSIQYIHDIKKQIEESIKKFDSVEILITDVSIIDLSILQYLISLSKSEKQMNKSFRISFDLEDDLNELLAHAGLKNIENFNQ